MKKIQLFFLFATLFLLPISLESRAQTSDNLKTVRKELLEFIRQEGYVPSLDDDGDIFFKYQGFGHYLIFEELDYGIYITLQVSFKDFDEMSFIEQQAIRQEINEQNRKKRCLKVYTVDNRKIRFVVETWIKRAEDLTPYFDLYLEGLADAIDKVFSAAKTVKS